MGGVFSRGTKDPAEGAVRTLRLFFRSAEYPLRYYAGTSREEMLASVLSVLRVASSSSAAAATTTNVLFLDDTGCPVALSSTALPDGLRLSVQIEQPPPLSPSSSSFSVPPAYPTSAAPAATTTTTAAIETPQQPQQRLRDADQPKGFVSAEEVAAAAPAPRVRATETTIDTSAAAIPPRFRETDPKTFIPAEEPASAAAAAAAAPQFAWKWDVSSRSCTHHFVSADGLRTGQEVNTGFGGVRGTALLGPGMHLWTMHISKTWCCCFAGVVVPADPLTSYGGKWMFSLQSLVTRNTEKAFRSDTGCPQQPLHVAFVLDGNLHILRAFVLDSEGRLPTGKTKAFLRVDNVPNSVYPALVFKHEIVFTLTSASRSQAISWVDLNDADRRVTKPAEGSQ